MEVMKSTAVTIGLTSWEALDLYVSLDKQDETQRKLYLLLADVIADFQEDLDE